LAASIRRVKGVKKLGIWLGNGRRVFNIRALQGIYRIPYRIGQAGWMEWTEKAS
jgi:hypothetical protein